MAEKTAVDYYLKDVKKTTAKIPSGETEVQRLIRTNLPYVISIARGYMNQGLSLEDIISEGNIGLVKAANKYDPTTGHAFSTYSIHWIRQSIMLALSFNRIVRLPLNKVYDIKKQTGSYGIERHVEMDKPAPGVEDDRTLGDMFSDDHNEVGIMEDREDNSYKIKQLLKVLKDRDREIVKMYYGIDKEYPVGTDVIGYELGMSSARVNQIVNGAIKLLKEKVCQ